MSIRLVVFNKVVLVRHDHKAAAFSDGDDGVDSIDAFHGGCLKEDPGRPVRVGRIACPSRALWSVARGVRLLTGPCR